MTQATVIPDAKKAKQLSLMTAVPRDKELQKPD